MNPYYNLDLSAYFDLWLTHFLDMISFLNDNIIMTYGFTLMLLCFLGLIILHRPPLAKQDAHDFSAIAGDNVISTQLDLARAYIEMSQHALAKPILKEVIRAGDKQQKLQARELIKCL